MKRKLPFFLALILALFLCTALTRAENLTPWQSLQEQLNAGGHIKLTQNVTAAAGESGLIVPSSVTVTLDLNGFTIDRGLADSSPQSKGYVIKNEGTLTIRDSSAAQTGVITGGNTSDWYQGGGISNINGDSILTLEGGAITGNKSSGGGGIVNFGLVVMNGGAISDNISKSGNTRGGGVVNSSIFRMYNGSITGNHAESDGGAVFCDHGYSDRFYMFGGTIG